jgi:SAM-dependent methyltransferase
MALGISLDDSYDDFPRIEEEFQLYLDESLDPRGPESVFDVLASLALPSGAVAVDVGCGDGRPAVQLAKRFGLRVHGVDPVRRNIELANAAADAEGYSGLLDFTVGSAESLPIADASADLVWCKEVLMFTDLNRAFREFARVLRPAGTGFVYQFLTGPRMTDDEAQEFWGGDLSYGDARNVRPADIEDAIASVGLVLRDRIDFASEWGEFAQERHGAGGRRLVHTARLMRDPARYIAKFGDTNYRIMLGDCLWHVYRMIGKLQGVAFVFTRPTDLQAEAQDA